MGALVAAGADRGDRTSRRRPQTEVSDLSYISRLRSGNIFTLYPAVALTNFSRTGANPL